MLEIIRDVVVSVLLGYLSLTQSLATYLVPTAPPLPDPTEHYSTEDDISETQAAPHYEYGGAIPDILIKSAAYQQATVIASQEQSSTTVTYTTTDSESALVNIYCTYTNEDVVRTSTGSGVIVTPTGVILTNAHVAQFLLLETVEKTGTTECIVRTGAIATAAYEAELLYISPTWIQKNAKVISQASPKGTGERDYALLYINRGINNTPVPASLPFVPVDTTPLTKKSIDSVVTIGGYPTLEPTLQAVEERLARKSATTTIAEVFTFVANTPDIFNVRGTPIGEYGISGGPVINASGKVIGLLATKSDDSKLGEGSLNAITLSYIDTTMLEETGFGFTPSVAGNLSKRSQIFKATLVPFLTNILTKSL